MNPFPLTLVLLGTLLVAAVHCDQSNQTEALVQFGGGGQVKGVVQDVDGAKVQFFLGIRYGKANRFEKPILVEPSSGVHLADKFGDGCPQFGNINIGSGNPMMGANVNYTEDCLFLNVIRPDTPSANRSVMVWIHGGAFEIGTASTPLYDSRHLVRLGDVVVVTVNYRLGPLGFMYAGDAAPANLGLYDQIAALQWVRKHIAHFGGNPNDVTVFGESAGSISVSNLVLSPLANGLFHRGIMQSGAATAPFVTQPKATLLAKTKIFAGKANCPVEHLNETVACLRNRTIAQLQLATNNDFALNTFFVPMFGDEVMPTRPTEALRKGLFNAVDLMFGVTRDEGTLFIPMLFPEFANDSLVLNETSAREEIVKLTKFYSIPHGEEVADYYLQKLPNATSDDYKNAVGAVFGDFHLACPTILFGEEIAKVWKGTSAKHNLYAYRLMQELSIPGLTGGKWSGVTHGQDAVYLFLPQLVKQLPNLGDLSDNMIHAWTAFAKTGHPGKMDAVQWTEAFDSNSTAARYMHLEALRYSMVDNHFTNLCDTFWKAKILD